APPPPEGSEEPPSGDEKSDDNDPPKDKDNKNGGGDENGGDAPKKDKGKKGPDGNDATEVKKGDEAAGAGKLPPLTDDRDAPPLAKEDAERHLEEAARRIRAEAVAYRRGKARSAPAGVKDW